MNKKQRKAEIKRNQKLARKAQREAAPEQAADVAARVETPEVATEARKEVVAPAPKPETQPETAIKPKRKISDARACEMLEDAARFLAETVQQTRAALAKVTPERMAEALDIINEPKTGSGQVQRRPRNGTDPVVAMIRHGIAASNLLKRIIKTLFPKLHKSAA